jgi:transcriptional regulator with XRE-family HTH domain
MSIVEQIAVSRKRRGITAAQVAERTGLQTSNLFAIEHGRRRPTVDTLERTASGIGLRLIAVDVGNQALVSDIAQTIAEHEASGAEELAYRAFIQLNNQLVSSSASTQVLLTCVPPVHISREWDAALAALIEWRLHQKDAPIPAWVEDEAGLTGGHWAPWPSIRYIDADLNLVPGPFRRRGIWLEAGELESA